MKLPKLYRKVWLHVEWLTDECIGGEHVQNDGVEFVCAALYLGTDNKKYWQPYDTDYFCWQAMREIVEITSYPAEDAEYINGLMWSESMPSYMKQEPLAYLANMPSIAQQRLDVSGFLDCPF